MATAALTDDQGFDAETKAAAVALAEGIARTMGIARQLIGNGRQVDLTGLDRGIGLLCAKALDLPPALGRTMRPHLAALLQELDKINATLGPPPG